ncbi:MAG: hypothetical protein EXR66_03895 [Dehalococcoidia bacterium]|nr:hypothetical protein [Dehalococcoidia bacterium]
MLTERFVVGVDDTDTKGPSGERSGGTGALVRALAAKYVAEGLGESHGVTRHQLFDSPKIVSTGDNCCYAVELQSDQSVNDIEDWLVRYVRANAERRADPGVAILSRHSDMPHVLAFGRRTQNELMKLEFAQTFSAEANVRLRAIGGKRLGSIGALAAAGLRAGGGDGRYVDLSGLRNLKGRMTAGQMRTACPALTRIIDDGTGEPMDRDDLIDTGDWVRPRLFEGGPYVLARRSETERRLWHLVDRRPEGKGG